LNYFDNKAVETAISQIRQHESVTSASVVFATEITKLVKAVINTNHLQRLYLDYEEIVQAALVECAAAIKTFDPTIRTAFTYFSLVTKYSVWNLIAKAKKANQTCSIDDASDDECQSYLDTLHQEDETVKQDESEQRRLRLFLWVNDSAAASAFPAIAKTFLELIDVQYIYDKKSFIDYCVDRGLYCINDLRKFFRLLKADRANY